MATFQGGASSDAAPLVLEIIKLTNLPKREHDRTRCPFLRAHLEPADAPPPLPPRSPEVSPKDLAKLMAQKSLSEEDAARVKDALALRDDVLEVDDRGYALDGTLLYGSPDGGPYRLARVQGTRDQGGDP